MAARENYSSEAGLGNLVVEVDQHVHNAPPDHTGKTL